MSVKSSHQTLMLAILMGMLAWMLDAIISWHYFPGKSFLDMLWEYDPQRTLFVRSTVVLLFFIFGLLVGWMVERLERQKALDRENILLLRGIRDIQDYIFQAKEPAAMLDEVATLLQKTFGFQDVYMVQVEPGSRTTLSRHTTRDLDVDLREFRVLEQQLALSTKPFTPGATPAPEFSTSDTRMEKCPGLLAPLMYNDVLYGVLLGLPGKPEKEKTAGIWTAHFQSACNQVGKALAHFHNLRENERTTVRIQHLYNLSPMGVFITTLSGKTIYFNPALRKMLTGSSTPDPDVEKTQVSSWYVNPSQREDFLRTLQAQGQINDFEFQMKTKQGGVRTVLMAGRLNRQVDPDDPHIEGFILDITNRRSAQESNRQLQQELQKSKHFRAITVLAGGVAHEFNNILQAMMGSAYLAQLKLQPDQEDISEYLDDIQDSGKRAARLCDQMLSYAGKRAMILKLEEADACLERALSFLQSDLRQKANLAVNLKAPHIRARLDIPSLSEIVNNLVLNAVESLKDLSEGKVVVSTSVCGMEALSMAGYQFIRSLNEDSYWVMSVLDTGPGIEKENLSHIFEPFYTTKFQGRGLGLSAVAGIVEKFDGNLGVRSTEGEGTEFVLCLPVAERVLLEDEERDTSPTELHLNPTGTIWVVDDEPLIGETLTRMLSRHGYDVKSEQNPLRFLEAFTSEEAGMTQCLILDVTMPEASGLEVLQSVRERNPDLPVLIMSGYDESEQQEAFERFHISGFIHKPFRIDDLAGKLNSIHSG